MPHQSQNPVDYIVPLNINGLDGRMLKAPATGKNKSEILLIYGHHALIERWWGLIENLRPYGNVTMPDLPGFGGMDSFAKIGKKPTIDNFADYLAAFVKLRYKGKRIKIYAISFGFVVVTRMLQRYPELAKKVDLVVAGVGFMHRDDFSMPSQTRKFYRVATRLFATRGMAFVIRYVGLNSWFIKTLYKELPSAKKRFVEVEPLEFQEMIEFEVKLWQANDVRTHWLTTSEFLNLDNCRQRIDLPVWHMASKGDHWFNNENVKQHMLTVFTDYTLALSNTKAHTPSVVADKKGLAVMVPANLKRALRKS
ncbi:MAG TPA: alpha/beta hydrolase [Candidatus Saccharimonadales bacterium]|nr:alpha/beta hydrolase [Candidatus Saccharimonadales bacterium]